MPAQQHVPKHFLIFLPAELLHCGVRLLRRRRGVPMDERDDGRLLRGVPAGVGGDPHHVVEPPVILRFKVVPAKGRIPRVNHRHREGVPARIELMGPLAIFRALIHNHRYARGFALKIVVPVAMPIVGVDGIIADERLGKKMGDVVAERLALKTTANLPQCGLERPEVIHVRQMLPAAAAALGAFPGAVPLDRPVDLPVCKDEIDVHSGRLVCFQEGLHPLADHRDAMLERERAAHRAAERRLCKRPAVVIHVLRPGCPVKERVQAARGMHRNHPAHLLLHSANAQAFLQRRLKIIVVPVD